ncbi:signal recognition particle protein [Fluviispira vulneris]|uniref:signal recognition particle protein n=1 Tax=Fluviispira vulneris TaxID=2763012 RepID=UPI001648CC35|nr:signal recognition particle protein [Fluviispira vulneris]
MFDLVTQGFKDASLKLKGQTRLTDENISPALEAIKRSLLDADVDLKVTKQFLENVRGKALDEVVQLKAKSGQKVSAGDHFIKTCHDELVDFLGGNQTEIIKNTKGPTVILLVGLQGAGKTTHAAKLAKLLAERHKMRPLLVAADVYRPAARDQLKILGEKINVPVFSLDTNDAVEIAEKGIEFARNEWLDLVIIDTAGRLAIDNNLMTELESIKAKVKPQNILLVIDSMIGQDAVRTASAFDQRLSLSGVILTKLDGDTRGGAALSVKKVTGKNILFVGTGESLEKLEEFRPDGMAGRILGMGDVVGLMDDFGKAIDVEKAEKSANRMMEGHFDFNDFLEMIGTIGKMGPIKDIIAKTPLAGQLSEKDMDKVKDKDLTRKGAIVQSMTVQERETPDLLLIQKSQSARGRIARIAKGSAHSEKEVKDLVDQFMQMRQMMQMMSGMGLGGGGILSKIPGLGQLNQMANMAKMAKMMGGGGMPGGSMGGLANMFGGGGSPAMPGGMGGGLSSADLAEINRMKKRKKEEKLKKQKKR